MPPRRSFPVLALAAAVFAAATILGNLQHRAEARPKYLVSFAKKYENLAGQAKAKKCAVCHPGNLKKVRNDYGKALAGNIPKNAKNAAVIDMAMSATEKMKNAAGETFGEIIESDKLPGSDEAAK